ncbi:imidazole glycerol phosphate synthase subunit HisH [Parenemella sanctibonifatiensis]|uniref:imidazole glycerol phosphate synthase subunit HisH n=1 Tax=Parenemella sanctibonifatiensis TaxID=2016505 RepID=UPI0039830E8E
MLNRRPQVVLFDYGSGNVHSAAKALALAGAEVVQTSDARVAAEARAVVVPGVGAYAACMEQLEAVGGAEMIRLRYALGGATLGICVGHQVMFGAGLEHGLRAPGVGVWGGEVAQLESPRLPHMGWNTLLSEPDSWWAEAVGDARVYFVHSYAALTAEGVPAGADVAWTEHQGHRFVSAVRDGSFTTTQFHPEKSGPVGIEVLRRWVAETA